MEIFTIRDLSFIYPGSMKKSLDDISLNVNEGEFITLCGLSGSGKSTLLRHLKTSLTPYGKQTGEILFNGKPLEKTDERLQAEQIGFVMQSPDHQSVTDKVWHELVFGLENLGKDNSSIKRRAAETASFFSITEWYNKKISELSGGQKQILNIACAMITSPDVLILDEPTAQLDPLSAERLMELLVKINKELGTTIIMSEHDLCYAFSYSDRIIVMENGKIISDKDPEKTSSFIFSDYYPLREAIPETAYIQQLLGNTEKISFKVSDGRKSLSDKFGDKETALTIQQPRMYSGNEKPLLEIRDGYFRYERRGKDILNGLSLKAYKGEIISVVGSNGSGKTTMLCASAGISKLYSGKVLYNGMKEKNIRAAYLPQNPQTLFMCESIKEELYAVFDDTDFSEDLIEAKIKAVMRLCGLENITERHPYDLSGGEQQKTALAKILLTSPQLILLDEPVKGTDVKSKNEIGTILRKLAQRGMCIVMVSHDMSFCAQYSDRCAMMFDGQLIGTEEVHGFFCGNEFYTTQTRRLTKGIIENCVSRGDYLSLLSPEQKNDKDDFDDHNIDLIFKENDKKSDRKKTLKKHKEKEIIRIEKIPRSRKQLLIMLLIILIAIPFTIFSGIYFLNNSKYLFISLLVLLECFVPFYMLFEKRHIRTREMVLIASMSAMCIVSRLIFYMLPEFKPVTAIVIISGAALGAESGFLIGSLSMLCSNIIFGQGPWTPWQMFAMGLIGFLSGIILGSRHFSKSRLIFAAFGFVSALVIYGGIMDPAAAVMSHIALTPETALDYYAAGLPLDIIHAASTAFFLLTASVPIIKKLERVKLKYGLVERSL